MLWGVCPRQRFPDPPSPINFCIWPLVFSKIIIIYFDYFRVGLGQFLGRAPRLEQAIGQCAEVTWPIISMCYIWEPCAKLEGRGGGREKGLLYEKGTTSKVNEGVLVIYTFYPSSPPPFKFNTWCSNTTPVIAPGPLASPGRDTAPSSLF